jgi:hypothetical protein
MLDICFYGVLLYYIWYTKQLLFFPYFCYGLAGTLGSSDSPSSPQWLDLSSDISFLPVAGLPTEPLPVSKTSVVTVDISSVERVS